MGDEMDHVGENSGDAGIAIEVPYPEPTEIDFDDVIGDAERKFYVTKYSNLELVTKERLHCTACDHHLGATPKNTGRTHFVHPMLRTLICKRCFGFYNSGEFDTGEDGSELYCRWCGQGGEVLCCSSCPVVFCAVCIKRNCGASKLKNIESADDWQCFKCDPEALWLTRSICWAVRRFCNIRNAFVSELKDPLKLEAFTKTLATDNSQCCQRKRNSINSISGKRKSDRIDKQEEPESKQIKNNGEVKKVDLIPMVKLGRQPSIANPSTPNWGGVINVDDTMSKLNNAKAKQVNSPVVVKPANKPGRKKNTVATPPTVATPTAPRNYIRRVQQPQPNQAMARMIPNDHLNLSLESLTQGLDLQALNAMTRIPGPSSSDAVVCTPDLPMPMEEPEEPVEDAEDDVQCMTPDPPKLVPKPLASLMEPAPPPPPTSNIMSRFPASAFLPYNIASLTTDDVTINKLTGGLKFKIDPNTLNSNKMYRLPDGRIFAITPNPSTPGGFSATIVTMSDSNANATASASTAATPARGARTKRQPPPEAPKEGATTPAAVRRKGPPPRAARAAKRAEPPPPPPPPPPPRATRRAAAAKADAAPAAREPPPSASADRPKRSLEWFKYNLTEAIDVVDYVAQRLNRLKTSTLGKDLKSKTRDEIVAYYDSFHQILKTAGKRIVEVRDATADGYREWSEGTDAPKATSSDPIEDDDDDDVEIVSDNLEETRKERAKAAAEAPQPSESDERRTPSASENENSQPNEPESILPDDGIAPGSDVLHSPPRDESSIGDASAIVETEKSQTDVAESQPNDAAETINMPSAKSNNKKTESEEKDNGKIDAEENDDEKMDAEDDDDEKTDAEEKDDDDKMDAEEKDDDKIDAEEKNDDKIDAEENEDEKMDTEENDVVNPDDDDDGEKVDGDREENDNENNDSEENENITFDTEENDGEENKNASLENDNINDEIENEEDGSKKNDNKNIDNEENGFDKNDEEENENEKSDNEENENEKSDNEENDKLSSPARDYDSTQKNASVNGDGKENEEEIFNNKSDDLIDDEASRDLNQVSEESVSDLIDKTVNDLVDGHSGSEKIMDGFSNDAIDMLSCDNLKDDLNPAAEVALLLPDDDI